MESRVVILGRGNVATALYNGLETAGVDVIQLWHRGVCLCADADIYVISVSDDAVHEVACLCPPNALVVHTAGSVGMDVIPHKRRGVIYPMQSFTKGRRVDWSRVPFFIESECDNDYIVLEKLVHCLSSVSYRLSSERRCTLHLAAVWVSNFTNHMWTIASELLSQEDLSFSIMLPLIEETAAKVHDMSPRQAQTGPARRGDISVLEAHEAMLSEELRLIYRLISRSIYDDTIRPYTH